MAEIIEKAVNLDERAALAKLAKDEMERLIEDFKPFLLSRVARYSHQCNEYQREELLSASMTAFYESIQNYDTEKGHFFSFSNRVVCERIIDHIRKIYRQENKTIPLDDVIDEHLPTRGAVVDEISMRAYETQLRQELLLEEIAQFESELSTWGITLETLSKQSPKHKTLRKAFKEAITKISQTQDIVLTIQQKRYVPIKAISEITGLSVKRLERARGFILASVIIKTGDYEILSEYVNYDL